MGNRVSMGLMGLTALAIAGNFVIALPLSSDDGSDILGLLLAIGASFLFFLLAYPLIHRFMNLQPQRLKGTLRIIYMLFLVFFIGVILIIAADTLASFAHFSAEVVLPRVNIGFIFVALLLTALFIASKSITAISKMGTVLFGICFIFCLIIFLLSLGDMSLKYLLPKKAFEIDSIIAEAGEIFISAFLEAFILISAIIGSYGNKKSITVGNAAGAILLVLCCLNTILVFGGGFASTLPYPYLSAVKTVGSKEIFSGTEGFLYVSVFFCSVVKAAIAFLGIKTLVGKIISIKKLK